MASARRDERRAVAYSGSESSSLTVMDNIAEMRKFKSVDNSDASQSADAVVDLVARVASDSFGQTGPEFPIFEAFSKLDSTSSLNRRVDISVRIFCTDDRRIGFRVLGISANKDYKYGSKVGYKKVPLEVFPLRNHPITDNLIKLCDDLGLASTFHDGKEGVMIQAIGQVRDNPYGCMTLIEYCQAKDRKPQFRQFNR